MTYAFLCHGSVRVLSDGKEVRLQFASLSTAVSLNDFWTIKSDTLKGIDSNKDDAAIGIYAVLCIAVANRVQY